VHAGWPGLAGGVVPAAVEALTALARPGGGDPDAIVALIGPTIRACCYEFGTADLAAVESRVGTSLRRTTRGGQPALDLVGGLRHQLALAGVGRVLDLGVCTACSPDHFSHRRDGRAGTGRQAVVVARRPEAA
jgi:polyphenol oxidase